MIEILFLVTALVALSCGLITVTSHHVVHALLVLVIMMLAIGLIFFLLGAPFAAALQIIVYAGAIMVLFVFVTMMLHQGESSLKQEQQLFKLSSAWLPLGLVVILLTEVVIIVMQSPSIAASSTSEVDTTKQIGMLLFNDYYQLVILAALMLLSALISAIHLSRFAGPRNISKEEEQP